MQSRGGSWTRFSSPRPCLHLTKLRSKVSQLGLQQQMPQSQQVPDTIKQIYEIESYLFQDFYAIAQSIRSHNLSVNDYEAIPSILPRLKVYDIKASLKSYSYVSILLSFTTYIFVDYILTTQAQLFCPLLACFKKKISIRFT